MSPLALGPTWGARLGGTSDDDAEVRAAFRAMLSAERAGYKLVIALVSTLVSYLVGTVELNDTSVRSAVSELDLVMLMDI